MTVNLNKIIASSAFSGFSNSSSVSFSSSIAGQTIAAGHYVSSSAFAALNNANSISQVQINLGGLESFWRLLPGVLIINYPNSSAPSYQIELFSYFTGGLLKVDTYVSNQTGAGVAIPTITINCRGFVFNSPF
jgi:hypothetical protein